MPRTAKACRFMREFRGRSFLENRDALKHESVLLRPHNLSTRKLDRN